MTYLRQFLFASALALMTILAACSASTEDLAKEVRASMEEKLKAERIEIVSFMLTHKGGNEYKGILETKEPQGEFTYAVEVLYDGEGFSWEIVE